MATWRADIKVTNTGSFFPVTIEAGSCQSAREAIEHIYRPVYLKNLRQESDKTSNESIDSSIEGTGALIGLAILGWVFISFTPWVLMTIGGGVGTWIGQTVCDYTLEEYADSECNENHGKAGIILALALILGGVGFVKGTEFKNYFDTPSQSQPAQVKQSK